MRRSTEVRSANGNDERHSSITVRSLPGGVVVALSGDHDLSTKPQLIEALRRVRRGSRLVIDLQRCTFVDSTIIGAILAAFRAGSSEELHLSVVLPDDTSYVYRALSVMGLHQLVPAHLSVEAALGR
jgi:anti-anti-sigma factor